MAIESKQDLTLQELIGVPKIQIGGVEILEGGHFLTIPIGESPKGGIVYLGASEKHFQEAKRRGGVELEGLSVPEINRQLAPIFLAMRKEGWQPR